MTAAAQVGRVNYQMMRRTFATLSIDAGASLKAVQGQLRHTSARMTTDVYAQTVISGAAEAVQTLEDAVFAKKISPRY